MNNVLSIPLVVNSNSARARVIWASRICVFLLMQVLIPLSVGTRLWEWGACSCFDVVYDFSVRFCEVTVRVSSRECLIRLRGCKYGLGLK